VTLDDLASILQDPETGRPLVLEKERTRLVESVAGRYWPVIDGRPCFLRKPLQQPYSELLDSHELPPAALDILENTDGLVLNLSAGATNVTFDNVVEVEILPARNTSVLSDAHILPFKDNTFSAVVCLNAFEHYHTPPKVAQEIHRVCKPNSHVYIETAFQQPQHMRPHHFYNATRHGVMKWFSGFSVDDCYIPPNGTGLHALAWAAATARWQVSSGGNEDMLEMFDSMTLKDLAALWSDQGVYQHPLHKLYTNLDPLVQEVYSGVVALSARVRKTPAG
jgi:SAM-dependent methyltransferase